jgi:hypothetical protein
MYNYINTHRALAMPADVDRPHIDVQVHQERCDLRWHKPESVCNRKQQHAKIS